MVEKNPIYKTQSELQKGMKLSKCRKCGCMKGVLESLHFSLPSLQTEDISDLLTNIEHWLKQMESINYACLGCEYCYPAVAMNIFNQAFPEIERSQSPSCAFEVREETLPPVPGEYFPFCDGPDCPIAVSTLGSVKLAEKLASMRPKELCIVGKTETENIGIDKIIKNTITNPTIRFLLLAGEDPKGHQSGRTLLSLLKNGVDENMKVIGSPGKRPILRNATKDEVEAFRRQVQVVDMIGCQDENRIIESVKKLAREARYSRSCVECDEEAERVHISTVPVVRAEEPERKEMDKAGYFVIIPRPEKKIISVEHYSYDNKLLRVIEGKDAKSIYWTVIKNGWIIQLSHAAYLGMELTKAELSIKGEFKYVQDGT